LTTKAISPALDTGATQELVVTFPDNRLLIDLCGEFDKNLSQVEENTNIQIVRRGNELTLIGEQQCTLNAQNTLKIMYDRLEHGKALLSPDIDAIFRFSSSRETSEIQKGDQIEMFSAGGAEIRTRKKTVEPRTPTQKKYMEQLFKHELVFGLGPAGTGKTYMAVAAAVSMFIEGQVDRIVLSRPAVEAGERLGFLPGDMKDKIDPYMQPLYDALNDFLPSNQLGKLLKKRKLK